MPLPPLEAGLVIRYNYLWRREADRRQPHSKDRPACIVAAVARGEGEPVVVILPVTHRRPAGDMPAIELPAPVKAHLGLDPAPSWVIVAECNIDVWPSPDLVVIPGKPGQYAYGHLPPKLFQRIRDAFVTCAQARRTRVVRREEE